MKKDSRIRSYMDAAIIAVMLSLFVRTFLFEAYKIPTPSMEQSLLVGDHIIVDKFALGPRLDFEGAMLPQRTIRRGDVVVFKFDREPEKDYVKRVIGMPGDEIRVDRKVLYVNGKEQHEAYARHVDPALVPERDFLPTVKVPAGHYFLMGDNRDNSADSREWGFVPRQRIRGRAVFIYWSVGEIKTIPTGPVASSATVPGMAGASAAIQGTRWERTLLGIH